MKKKKSIVISLAFLFLALLACEQEDQINSSKSVEHTISVDKNSIVPLSSVSISKSEIEEKSCGEAVETILYAGQDIEIGKILVSNDDIYLYVTYDLSETDWWLSETHLFAGDIALAPFTNSGNPQIGKFPYHGTHDLTREYTFAVPLENLQDPVSVIAHAAVVLLDEGQTTGSETAFGYGDIEFPGSRWGWIINYEQQSCEGDEAQGENGEDGDDSYSEDGSNNINTGQNNNPGDRDETGCMDAYAYSGTENSICFLNDFDTWGWTNNVPYNDGFSTPSGFTYAYPLYASAFQCDIENSMLIGQVSINVSGGDGVLYANVTVTLTNQDLILKEIDIYIGDTLYPLDAAGQSSISFGEFDISERNLNVKTYSTTSDDPANWLEWPIESYFIVHARVCPGQ